MGNKLSTAKKVSLPGISLPKGGGAIKGIGELFKFNAFTGTGSFSVPVYTSPCRDFEPKISLDYNSAEGNGVFGMGFSISIPYISRKTEKGIPRYDSSDAFILSNADELVPKLVGNSKELDTRVVEESGINWRVTGYLPRVEGDFARIEFWEGNGSSYWKIVSKGNITSVYGQSENARIANPEDSGCVFRWLLEKAFDAKGNKVEYLYKQENVENVSDTIYEQNRSRTANKYIRSIRYGNYFNESLIEKWSFEVVFDYGEYNVTEDYLKRTDCDPYKPVRGWAARKTPFSSYRSGFELRTSRLCQNILMFHHLEKELGSKPCLVRVTSLTYGEAADVSPLLEAVEVKGLRRNKDGSYASKPMPPLEYTYSGFTPEGQSFENLRVTTGKTVPCYVGKGQYDFVDLYGESIPGLLYSDDNTTFYLEPQGNGEYGFPLPPILFPLERNLQDADYMLTSLMANARLNRVGNENMDLMSNGSLDFLVNAPGRKGFYEANPDGTWKPFRPFKSCPLDLDNADKELEDMNGDGIPDLLVFENDGLKVYPSLSHIGFGMPERTCISGEGDETFPISNNGNEEEVLSFADMFGDGLSHRVRIRNGMVECWPNMGYGHFGKRVLFGNAPRYGDKLDASRLFFADVDGSGVTDIVYVHPDRVDVFLNQGGNSFKEPISIPLPEIYDSLSSISFADVKGNGSTCMVFSKLGTNICHYCYDFTGGIKPWLLTGIDNNMGAITRIGYASSVKFYLEDKKSGTPWKTKIPFPVHVVEKVEAIDRISGSKLVSSYKYHDGCYDYYDKEFRGFGYVEQWDTESFDVFSKHGLLKDTAFNAGDSGLHVPPVHTKRWYHTGAYTESGILSKQYRAAYYQQDSNAYVMPDSVLDPVILNADTETIRQACRALKGLLLREEIYGLDGQAGKSEHPYSVMESNFYIRQIQPVGDNQYGVFFPHDRESISYHYERNAADPRIQHSFVLEVDTFGNIKKSCDVFYPRREADYPEQAQLKASMELGSFINHDGEYYLTGIPYERKVYEISGLDLHGKEYFNFEELEQQLGETQERLLSWERMYFWNEKQEDYLPLGEVTPLALVHHTEAAEFSDTLIDTVFGNKVSPGMLEIDGGYALKEGYWWNRGLVEHYYRKEDNKFYLPWKVENSFAPAASSLHIKTALEYDSYCMAPIREIHYLTDEIANTSSILLDYITLQPIQFTDINGNISQIILDPLGNVIATSAYGMSEGKPQGDRDLKDYVVIADTGLEDVLSNPHKYLQNASAYFYYDIFAWIDRGQPACFAVLNRETHVSDLQEGVQSRIQIELGYTDGFGREIEKKVMVDPGDAVLWGEGGTLAQGYAEQRWLVSGRTVYNNKAMPVKQYLPYFSSIFPYEAQEQVDAFLPPPMVTWYDPLLRVVRVDTPKGFFSKVEFTPWQETNFDEDDTVKDSLYYNRFMKDYPINPSQVQKDEKDALDKAACFYNTPQIKVLDSMGHVFLDIQRPNEGESLKTYSMLDIEGRVIKALDPRLYAANMANGTDYYNFKHVYSLSGTPLSVDSADAGLRLSFGNIFGNTIHAWDSRGFHMTMTYDSLGRPINIHVDGNDGRGTVLDQTVEKLVYGEYSGQSGKNLRGKIYKHYDQAGVITFDSYDIHGNTLKASRQLRTDYKNEVDWDNPNAIALENEIFDISYTYDALGRVLSEKEPDGNIQHSAYNQAGFMERLDLTYKDGSQQAFVQSMDYNAQGQRLQATYGNGVMTKYTYEASTLNLLGISSTRPGQAPLQNIVYSYDPVDNITRVRDHCYETVFNNQQMVEPLSDYTYDGLYRLIGATGRQHPGIKADTHWTAFKQCGFTPFPTPNSNDGEKLENYRETYSYDAAGNLTTIRHVAPSASWTRQTGIEAGSNRTTLIASMNGTSGFYETPHDANGNLQGLENLRSMTWNYRNNLSRADVIVREDGSTDSEYYVYDNTGQRIRRITERKVSSTVTEIEEKIYIGSLEIKRIKRRSGTVDTLILDRQSRHVMDGSSRIAIVHYWLKDDSLCEVDNPGVRKCRYQLSNHLGSSGAEVDENASLISYEEYFPYGGTSLIAGRSEREVKLKEYRYSSKERDDMTGLYYYGLRYYPPWLGRWINPDPAGTVDGLNLYGFVGGNPVVFADIGGMGKNKAKGPAGTAPPPKKIKANNGAVVPPGTAAADPNAAKKAAAKAQREAKKQAPVATASGTTGTLLGGVTTLKRFNSVEDVNFKGINSVQYGNGARKPDEHVSKNAKTYTGTDVLTNEQLRDYAKEFLKDKNGKPPERGATTVVTFQAKDDADQYRRFVMVNDQTVAKSIRDKAEAEGFISVSGRKTHGESNMSLYLLKHKDNLTYVNHGCDKPMCQGCSDVLDKVLGSGNVNFTGEKTGKYSGTYFHKYDIKSPAGNEMAAIIQKNYETNGIKKAS